MIARLGDDEARRVDAFIAADGAVTGAAPSSYSTKRTDVNEVKVVGLRRKIAEQTAAATLLKNLQDRK